MDMVTHRAGERALAVAAGCTTADCGEDVSTADAPAAERLAVEPGDFAQLWADAKAAYFTQGYPRYGSREWQVLHPDDPKRLASALHAAECWRKYGDEQELIEWFKSLSRSPESIARRRTVAELGELAKPRPPHQLRATPGWPPVRIPGQPHMRRHLRNGKQVDVVDHDITERAA
ncbi:hypothetical protein ABZ672_16150 [Streptomyces mirabilis]|uniref:hypothetical protein n=1 Tax=Streptomyces mirabilis TaxID=68239 RepID=UPI0033E93310